MINKILASTIFISCLFALLLALNGVSAPIWFGDKFRGFIVVTNQQLSNYKIAIPDIPFIPEMSSLSLGGAWYEILLRVVVNFVQLWIKFINGLISLLNFVILAINTIIQLIEFVFILLKNFITLKDSIVA